MACLRKRWKAFYAQYNLGGQQKCVSLHTNSLHIAKEKIRQVDSAIARGTDIPLSPRAPVAQVVEVYVHSLSKVKTPRNVQHDIQYLKSTFVPICPELELKNTKIRQKGLKRPGKEHMPPIKVNFFEQITTADIAGSAE